MTHVNPPTRARDLVTAVVTVGIRFERPAAEVNSARAERPRREVEVVSDLEGRLFQQPTTIRPSTTLELDGWLADGLDPPTVNLFASKQDDRFRPRFPWPSGPT